MIARNHGNIFVNFGLIKSEGFLYVYILTVLPQIRFLSTWADIHYVNLLQVTDISNEIIWNNTNIKYMNEALYLKDWVGNGILQAKQLF